MARVKYVNFAVDATGAVISSASIEVRDLAGNLATLYSAETGVTEAYSGVNPFNAGDGTPNPVGYFEFFVEPGVYNITVGTGASAVTYEVSLLFTAKTYFSTRSALSAAVSGGGISWADGTIISDGRVSYVATSGATAISDLPGLLPFGEVTPNHFAENTSPGFTDMGAAINAAVSYASTAGAGKVGLLATDYYTTLLHTIPNFITLEGVHQRESRIFSSRANGEIITLSGTQSGIKSLWISSKVTRTADAFVRITGGSCVVDDVRLNTPFIGIYDTTDFGGTRISNSVIWDAEPGGDGILLNKDGPNTLINDVTISGPYTTRRPATNIRILWAGDTIISNCSIVGGNHAIHIEGPAGFGSASLNVTNTYFDNNGTTGLFVSGTARLVRASFIGCWFGDNGTYGVNFDLSTGAIVDGVSFVECRFLRASYGIHTTGVDVIKNLHITGGNIGDMSVAGARIDGVQSGKMLGVRIGPNADAVFGPNDIGIIQTGNTSNFTIAHCDLRGNTTDAINRAGLTGTDNIWESNEGFTLNNRLETMTRKTLSAATSGEVTIADDAFTAIPMPDDYDTGMMLITDTGGISVLVFVKTVGTAVTSMLVNNTIWESTTGALTGTTGTDTKYTVSADSVSGNVYIENRVGTAKSFSYVFLATGQ